MEDVLDDIPLVSDTELTRIPAVEVKLAETNDGVDELRALQEALKTPSLPDWYVAGVQHRIEWLKMARPNQLRPLGEWSLWLVLAGRGFGKTRCSAEDAFWFALTNPGVRVGIVAPTLNDLKKICFEGESGLCSIIPEICVDKYNSSFFELTLKNGSKFEGFASEAYERLRGPQFHMMWFEEMAAWKNLRDTYDQAMFTLRLRRDSRGREISTRAIASTTPKPHKLLLDLIKEDSTVVTKGTTMDNRANLSKQMLDTLLKYEGTDLGRQEIYADILDLSASAALKRKWWKVWDTSKNKTIPLPERIIISMDTAWKDRKESDSTACTVWGITRLHVRGRKRHPRIPGHYMNTSKSIWAIILLEAWKAKLQYPDLRMKAKDTHRKWVLKMAQARDEGQEISELEAHLKVDMLIEDKASGIGLIQEFERANMQVIPYNPGIKSKRHRVDVVSDILKSGKIYAFGKVDESGKIHFKGSNFKEGSPEWINTPEAVIHQCENFTGIDNGEADVDDYVDTCSQAWQYARDLGYAETEADEDYFVRQSSEEEEAEYNRTGDNEVAPLYG